MSAAQDQHQIGDQCNQSPLELLAQVVFNQNFVSEKTILDQSESDVSLNLFAKSDNLHRVSCHKCGNVRKRKLYCAKQTCPHVFCVRCAEKMTDEFGADILKDGCPVCKERCCCSNKSISCGHKNHCYRKCPASKTSINKVPDDSSDNRDCENDIHTSKLCHVVKSEEPISKRKRLSPKTLVGEPVIILDSQRTNMIMANYVAYNQQLVALQAQAFISAQMSNFAMPSLYLNNFYNETNTMQNVMMNMNMNPFLMTSNAQTLSRLSLSEFPDQNNASFLNMTVPNMY